MLSHATSNDHLLPTPVPVSYSRGSNVPVTATSRPLTIAPDWASLSTVSASRPKQEHAYQVTVSRRRLDTASENVAYLFPDVATLNSGSRPSRPTITMFASDISMIPFGQGS